MSNPSTMSDRRAYLMLALVWLALIGTFAALAVFDAEHSRAARTAEHSADSAHAPTGANLHRLALLCSRERPSIGYGPRTCDFPSGRFYVALAREYGHGFPEDQAGAIMRAYAVHNVSDRRAAIRRALAGIGY